VSEQGQTVDAPGYYYASGSVQPSPGRDLLQLPETERAGVFITVVTTFRLFPLTATTAPDQVVWQGKNYRVKHVNDWSEWGGGFVNAICELTDVIPDGP
jgi:hypothetical protein